MNKYLQRQATKIIDSYFADPAYHGRILIIYGPRQIGKTTLVKKVLETQQNGQYFNCDLLQNQELFSYQNAHTYPKPSASLI